MPAKLFTQGPTPVEPPAPELVEEEEPVDELLIDELAVALVWPELVLVWLELAWFAPPAAGPLAEEPPLPVEAAFPLKSNVPRIVVHALAPHASRATGQARRLFIMIA
jgi:hypothetical protein